MKKVKGFIILTENEKGYPWFRCIGLKLLFGEIRLYPSSYYYLLQKNLVFLLSFNSPNIILMIILPQLAYPNNRKSLFVLNFPKNCRCTWESFTKIIGHLFSGLKN